MSIFQRYSFVLICIVITILLFSYPVYSQTMDMHLKSLVLIPSSTDTSSSVLGIKLMLDSVITPYDIIYTFSYQPTQLYTLTDASGAPLYNAIFFSSLDMQGTVPNSSPPVTSASMSTAQFSQIYSYMLTYNVRATVFRSVASAATMGLASTGVSEKTSQLILNPAGNNEFIDPATKTGVPIPVSGWLYCSKSVDTSKYTPVAFLKDFQTVGNQCIISAIVTISGRQEMHIFADMSYTSLGALLLYPTVLRWTTRGVFIGQRQTSLLVQIDGFFGNSNMYDVATKTNSNKTFRPTTAHLQFILNRLSELRQTLPSGSSLNIEFAIRGGSVPLQQPLSDDLFKYAATFYDNFYWTNNGYYGSSIAGASRESVKNDVETNIALMKSIIPSTYTGLATDAMVTPAISGLREGAVADGPALQGLYDAGVRYVVGDNSYPALRSANNGATPFLCYKTNTATHGFDNMWVVPREVTEIFFSTYDDVSEMTLYNSNYLLQQVTELDTIMAREVARVLPLILSYRQDPYQFNQPNLNVFKHNSRDVTLLSLWYEAILEAYNKYMNMPLKSLTITELARKCKAKTITATQCNSDIVMTLDRSTWTVSVVRGKANADCNIPIQGVSGPGSTPGTFPDVTTVLTAPPGGGTIPPVTVTTVNSFNPPASKFPTVPDAVISGSVVNVTSNAINVAWAAPTHTGGVDPTGKKLPITSYKIEHRPTGSIKWVTPDITLSNPTTLATKLSSLAELTSYEMRVTACNTIGCSMPSVPFIGNTTAAPTSPSPPTPISFSAISKVSFVASVGASVSNGGSPILRYESGYKLSSAADIDSNWKSSTSSSTAPFDASVSSLTGGTAYDFRSRSCNIIGCSAWTTSSTTTSAAVVPGPVQQLSSSGIDAKSGTVAWTPPADIGGSPIIKYSVQTRPRGGTWSSAVDVTNPTMPISPLAVNTNYDVSVVACNIAGCGPPTQSSFQTSSSLPMNLSASPIDSVTGKATWSPPSDMTTTPPVGYKVSTRVTGTNNWSTPQDTTIPNALFPNLKPDTRYDVQVVTCPIKITECGAAAVTTFATPPTTPPSPVVNLSATPSGKLSWSPPINNGGCPISNYNMKCRQSPNGDWSSPFSSITTSSDAPSLVPNTSYDCQVSACNVDNKCSIPSTISFKTPIVNPPGPVTLLNSVGISSNAANVTWSPPSSAGDAPVTKYVVNTLPKGSSTWGPAIETTTPNKIVNGLTSGSPYEVQVSACNIGGCGPVATVPMTSFDVPSKPDVPSVTPTSPTSMTVSWVPPASNGGAPITAYEVYTRPPGGGDWTLAGSYPSSSRSADLKYLTPGQTLETAVKACNSVGCSLMSDANDTGGPQRPPSSPLNPTATGYVNNDGSLTWTNPTEKNQVPISIYKVFGSINGGPYKEIASVPANATNTIGSLTAPVKGQRGTFTFQVSACNQYGCSALSAASNIARGAERPAAPGKPRVSEINATSKLSHTVDWEKPIDDGGSPITHYRFYFHEYPNGAYGSPMDVKAPLTEVSTLRKLLQSTPTPTAPRSAVVTDLNTKKLYQYVVSAVNAVGEGPQSPPSDVLTLRFADAPYVGVITPNVASTGFNFGGDYNGSDIRIIINLMFGIMLVLLIGILLWCVAGAWRRRLLRRQVWTPLPVKEPLPVKVEPLSVIVESKNSTDVPLHRPRSKRRASLPARSNLLDTSVVRQPVPKDRHTSVSEPPAAQLSLIETIKNDRKKSVDHSVGRNFIASSIHGLEGRDFYSRSATGTRLTDTDTPRLEPVSVQSNPISTMNGDLNRRVITLDDQGRTPIFGGRYPKTNANV